MYNSVEECKNNYHKEKIYTHPKYPDKKLLTNFILSNIELDKFLNKNLEVKLVNNKSNKIELNSKLKNYLDKKINNKLFNFTNRNETLNKTFKYLFNNTLDGMYVKIINNKIKIFYHFHNEEYKNDWIDNIKISDYLKNRKNIDKDTNNWSSNNCIINNRLVSRQQSNKMEYARVLEFKYFLNNVCKKYKIKDIDFFINRRDFPVIRNDGKHPYYHLYNEVTKYKTDNYIATFSQSVSNSNADIPIVNVDDIMLLTQKAYAPKCKISMFPKQINWDNKIDTAFFRGTATGCGVTIQTNQRLKLAKISFDLNNKSILNAGVVSWNYRDKIYNKELTLIHPKKLGFPLVNKVTLEEQMKYKYLIHVDGHVSAYRLLRELDSGSIVLKVESENNYEMWFSSLLEEYINYIPIKKDLSDLIDKIKWCKNNDDKCKKIAENSISLRKNILNLETAKKYMAYSLNNIK